MMTKWEFFKNAFHQARKAGWTATHEGHIGMIVAVGLVVIVLALCGIGMHLNETALIVWPVVLGIAVFVYWFGFEAYYRLYRDECNVRAEEQKANSAMAEEVTKSLADAGSRLPDLGPLQQAVQRILNREALGSLMWEGTALASFCADESREVLGEETDDWRRRAESFLLNEMGQKYFQRFRDHNGIPPLNYPIRSEFRRKLWDNLRCCVARLNEFHQELLAEGQREGTTDSDSGQNTGSMPSSQ